MTKKKTVHAPRSEQLRLPAQLNIAQAADLHRDLKERIAAGALVIDAAQVEQVDTAILQLLVSSWRTCARRGVACSWHGVSANLRASAKLIGVAEVLNFPGS